MITEFEYISAVKSFLESYPYALPYKGLIADYEQLTEHQNSDKDGAGAALRFAGDRIVLRRKNVLGQHVNTKTASFALVLYRLANDDVFGRDTVNSLTRLINWVNDQNALRGTVDRNPMLPRFSMTNHEVISASGGAQTAILPDGRNEYQVQIVAEYQLTH
ncbi:MAG: hypothetical protein FWC66_05185 [Oscillospiraceae bacterium]|nr:hypothetical protein [Oscillospiraceae bacterium]